MQDEQFVLDAEQIKHFESQGRQTLKPLETA